MHKNKNKNKNKNNNKNTRNSLLTTHYSLLTTHWWPRTTHYSLLSTTYNWEFRVGMFPGCHPCSCSPSLLRFDFEFARASPSSHSHALPVHALRQVITHFPAFLRMIGSWGCLITRKNAGIVPLALYESQMGGLNHTYFTHDGALGRFHAAVGPLRSLHFYVWLALGGA